MENQSLTHPSPAAIEVAVNTVFQGEISRPASCALYKWLQSNEHAAALGVRAHIQYSALGRAGLLSEVSRIAFHADRVLRPYRELIVPTGNERAAAVIRGSSSLHERGARAQLAAA